MLPRRPVIGGGVGWGWGVEARKRGAPAGLALDHPRGHLDLCQHRCLPPKVHGVLARGLPLTQQHLRGVGVGGEEGGVCGWGEVGGRGARRVLARHPPPHSSHTLTAYDPPPPLTLTPSPLPNPRALTHAALDR